MTEASLAMAVQEIGMAEVAVEAVLADAREFKSPWLDVSMRASVVSKFDRHYHECWQHLDRAAAAVRNAGRSTDKFDATRRTLGVPGAGGITNTQDVTSVPEVLTDLGLVGRTVSVDFKVNTRGLELAVAALASLHESVPEAKSAPGGEACVANVRARGRVWPYLLLGAAALLVWFIFSR
jgi:hypothetical protein